MMAFKFLTLSLLMLLASSVKCEVSSEPFAEERVDPTEPTERGDFTIVNTNMDESMILMVQTAIDGAYGNYPESAASRVGYIRGLLDDFYNDSYWHVVEDFSAVSYHRRYFINLYTTRNSIIVKYLIWSTANTTTAEA